MTIDRKKMLDALKSVTSTSLEPTNLETIKNMFIKENSDEKVNLIYITDGEEDLSQLSEEEMELEKARVKKMFEGIPRTEPVIVRIDEIREQFNSDEKNDSPKPKK